MTMDFVSTMRKGLASITLTALAATSLMPVQAAANLGFNDDSEIPSWAGEAIEELMYQGVLSGNDDGSFAPNRQLNRAEVSKIIVLATGVDLDTTGGPHFPDVQPGAWYYDYIETMYNLGWINGYPDGYFRPGVGINRAEIAKMVVNAFAIEQDLSGAPHFDDVSEGDWFFGYVETAYNNDLIRGYGDGTFGPANAVTRAETAKIVYDAQLVAYQPVGNPEGTLEAMLSDYTARGTNIPYNAVSVPFTTIELTASDDSDVEISSLTFTRLGLGDNDDFDNVWLEIDGFKVGNDKSINNDDVVELRFNPPVVVPAGQTLMADVVASTKYTSTDRNVGHHNRLALISADDIVSTAVNVVGDFPIEGEEMEVADYEVSQIKFSTLGSDTTVDVGDQFIEIGKFRMLNASDSNKDVEIRAVTFKNDGSAELEDNLENVALYVSGEQVSAETIIDGDYITFRLDNGITGGYIIEDGDSKIFSVRADIVSAEKNDVINFKVDNFEDIVGVEIGTAFGVKAISGNSTGVSLSTNVTETESSNNCTDEDAEDNCARLRAYEIDSGDLNIARDPASLGNQQYAPGSNDVVFLTARLVVDQPLIVDGVRIDVAAVENIADLAELNKNFDNFRLYLNDKLIDTENEFTGTTANDAYLDFETTFEIAGTSILKVVGNIEDGAETGDEVKLEVTNTAFDSPEYISTGDQVSADEVLGSAQASFVQVEESDLVITRTDGLTDGDQIVAGVDDVTFMEFVLDNNDSGDVKVTSVTVNAIATGAASQFSNFTAAIFVDGQQQGSARNLEKSGSIGTATFNDLAVVIPSAGQKEFEVVVDTIEASANSNIGTATVVKQASTEVVATDMIYERVVYRDLDNDPNTPLERVVTGTGFVTTAIPADTSAIYIPDTSIFTGLPISTDPEDVDGVEIAISVDGAATGTNAENFHVLATQSELDEINRTDYVKLTLFDNANIVTETDNSHPIGEYIGRTDAAIDYLSGATKLYLSSVEDFENGDQFYVQGSSDQTLYTITADNEAEKSITFTPALTDTAATDDSFTLINNGGATIVEPSNSSIRLFVTDVDADNVENGQTVTVTESGITLGAGNADADTTNGDCHDDNFITSGISNAGTSNNYLCGVQFNFVESGTLKAVGVNQTLESDIIVANSTNNVVYKLRFDGADDEIQVKDIYLKNTVANSDFGDRVTFKLYNEAGQLLQEKQMTDLDLHFELANQDRIRVPKDGSTTVTVKVDVRDITKANQTGEQLILEVDTTKGVNGFEAVTAATGSDLDNVGTANVLSPVDHTGKSFVAYRSNISVKHASSQPSVDTGATEFYRFTVSADAAKQIEVSRLSFNVTSIDFTATDAAMQVRRVNGTTKEVIASEVITGTQVVSVSSAGLVSRTGTAQTLADGETVEVEIDFASPEQIAAGQSQTYELSFVDAVDGTNSDEDGIKVEILDDASNGYVAPNTVANLSGTLAATTDGQNVIWSDSSGTAIETSDFLNGYLIDIDDIAKTNK
jgi:hypothetical protein